MSPDHFTPDFRITPLSPDAAKYVVSLSVISEIDTLNQFSMTLANPLPKLPWTHGDYAGYLREGDSLAVELGYVGRLRPMFHGVVTGFAPSFPDAGAPTLTVTGHTRMHALRGARKTRTFVKMSDQDIVGTLAGEAGLSVDADSEPTLRYEYVIQYNETDLGFLMRRARGIGFELTVEDNTLRFKRARTGEEPVYRLVWRHPQRAFAPDAQTLPLRKFSIATNPLGQITEVIVRGQMPKSREVIVGRAPDGAQRSSMGKETGADVVASALGGRRTEVVVDRPVASEGEATALAMAIYKRRLLDFVVGEGSTIGLPELQAGQVVDLDGLGERFNGRYYVKQATHSISSGGYSTSFAVARDAVG